MWIAVCFGRRTHRKPHCLSCLCATWPTSSPTIKAPIFFIISLEQRVPGGPWWALEYSYLSSPKQSSQNRSIFFGSLPAPVDPESPKYFFPLFVDPGRNLKDEWRSRDMLYPGTCYSSAYLNGRQWGNKKGYISDTCTSHTMLLYYRIKQYLKKKNNNLVGRCGSSGATNWRTTPLILKTSIP